MAILYRRYKMKVNRNGSVREEYVAKNVLQSTVDLDDIADYIAHNTTMTQGEVFLALQQLEDCLETFILNGSKVDFGRLGTFAPQIEATAMPTPEKVTHRSIKRVGILYKPSKRLKEKLAEAQFHLLDDGAVFTPMYRGKKKKQEDLEK